MTIKQQGGIFGRNPSFNNVEANDIDAQTLKLGNLTNGRVALSGVDGLVTDNSTLTYDGLNAQVAGGTSRGGFVAKSDLNIAGLYMKTATATNRGASAEFLAHNDFFNSIGWRISNSSDINGDWNLHFGVSGATSDYSAISYTDIAYFNSNGLAFPNGKGIDFSATSGTGTSELFDDYEEGTWTPVISVGSTGTATANYTKIGNMVTVTCKFVFATVGVGAQNITWASLPFTPSLGRINGTFQLLDAGTAWYSGVAIGDSTSDIQFTTTGDVRLTNVAPFTLAANDELNFTITYRAD